MARIVTNNKFNRETLGFDTVVDEICRGHYALVLGSDVMLDKNYNPEVKGDSTLFFLERVIETKNEGEIFPQLNPWEGFENYGKRQENL